MTAAQEPLILHASCVGVQGKGVLILGPSGSGKSSLALQLMAFGARLISDDRTEIICENNSAIARCPAAISGLIEARGIGILRVSPLPSAELALVIDLGQNETDRLPKRRHVSIAGIDIDLVLGPISGHFPAAVLCYLSGHRQE